MSLIVSENRKQFSPPPEGLLHCVCADVVDLGIVEGQFGPQHKVQIIWQTADVDENGKRFLIFRQYTPSLSDKSRLRPMLESWRGKKFTAEELGPPKDGKGGFDLENVISANCQIQIVHKLRTDGSKGYDVQAVVPAPKGVPMLKVEGYTRKKDRTDQTFGAETADQSAVPF